MRTISVAPRSALALVLLLAGAAAGALLAQQQDSTTRTVKGVVTHLRGESANPKSGSWVVLHRVGEGDAGAIDSVRTNAAGEFTFRIKPSGPVNSVYSVSSSHAGIAYLSAWWHADELDSADANLTVFDTTTRPVPFTVTRKLVTVEARGLPAHL
jgi:hypothetical protein